MYKALKWFKITVGLGFVLNMIFVLPALFVPRALEGWLTVGTSNTIWWIQEVGLLLVIGSIMYIPAIKDPFRYIFITYLLVAARFLTGLLFLIGILFMSFPSGFWLLSGNDLVLSTLQAVLIYFMLRAGDPKAASGEYPG